MPVFPETNVYYKGRTHTQLVVSEGNAPAEKYLASEATNGEIKFQYEFGPEGNNSVVIPKGKILSFAGVEYDVETEKNIPRVEIATTGDIPMGVNHHNVYQRRRDKFSGSEPTLLTREYIRVPLFSGTDAGVALAAAGAIQFGAMSALAETQADKNALLGKYVTNDANGNFVVTDAPTLTNVIGQVYGIETDMPPAGFLQYFLEFNDTQYLDFIKQTQIVPSPGRTSDKTNTLDIATYPVGTGYFKTTQDLAIALKSFKAGIPFLTDGYFKARTLKTYVNLSGAEAIDVRGMGNVVVTPVTTGTAPNVVITSRSIEVTDYIGAALFIRLKEKICHDALPAWDYTRSLTPDAANFPEYGGVAPSSVVVRLRNAANALLDTTGTYTDATGVVSPANYHVDYENNMIVLYFTETLPVGTKVEITATVLEAQIPGIPTGWDFKNNIGEARILLMK